MMSFDMILATLQDAKLTVRDIAYKDYNSEELGLGKCDEMADGRNGGEDQGSNWERVYFFVDHNVYLKVSGYYQSYEGVEFYDGWKCITETKPRQIQINIYD